MRIRFAAIAFLIGLNICNSARACGPFFPYAYFAFGRERDVLKLPELWFGEGLRELDLPKRPSEPRLNPSELQSRSRERDANQLAEALKATGTPDDVAAGIVEAYRAAREQNSHVDTKLLPREFALYAEGASLYHAEHVDEAVAKWEELLALPANERHYKSVWAAYMIGRAFRDTDAGKANAAFEQTRKLAAEGFSDPLDLAAESIGWQAHMDYAEQNYVSAVEKYVERIKTSRSDGYTAYMSLDMACSHIVESPERLDECVSNPTVRTAVTAWIVSHPSRGAAARPWVMSLAKDVPLSEIPQADLLAWAAYSSGDFETARKLLDAPSADTRTGKQVRYKLLLRDGKIDEAMALMQEVASEAPERTQEPYDIDGGSPPASSRAELGVLRLGRRQYVEAFDNFLREKYWFDAAYIGDRVMTTDELKEYVDSHATDPLFASPFNGYYDYGDVWHEEGQTAPIVHTLGDATRYLLGRRLARDDRWSEAIGYLPPKPAEKAKQFVALRDAAKADEPAVAQLNLWDWFVGEKPRVVIDRDRATKLESAADFMRTFGMEMMGTEVQPDWHLFDGRYELPWYHDGRIRWEPKSVATSSNPYAPKPENLPEELDRILSASEDELRRVRENAPQPDKRFHYRYVAADLMWQSALNLPDNDIDTMRTLYKGGKLIERRDPVAANRFYRSLVWRNLNMPYAQQADKLRWFPEKAPE